MLQCAFNPVGFHYISRDQPKAHEMTTTSCIRPLNPPSGRLASRKKMAQAVRNGSGVTNRNNWQFSHDSFNGDDVENWFLAVELVPDPGTDRVQPA